MKNLFLIMIFTLMVSHICGCYNRNTGNFEHFPDINNLPSGVVDQAGLTDEDKRRQLEFLKQLDLQQEPVYRINAGDKISIRVYNHPDLIMESLVTPDGAIGVMFAGQVQVAGLTLEEASKKIKEIYGRYIKNPELGVFAIDIRSQTATISGAVNNPGMFVISNGMRLADLFAKGISSDAEIKKHIKNSTKTTIKQVAKESNFEQRTYSKEELSAVFDSLDDIEI